MFIFKSQYEFEGEIELGVQLSSDLQIGAADTDYKYIANELERAADRHDRINFNGDIFDAIFPGDRKRFRPSVLHSRLRGVDNLATASVAMAYDLISPVKEFVDVIGVGNHDDSNVKYHHDDLVFRLIEKLNIDLTNSGSHHRIHYGGYCGFIAYIFYDLVTGQFVDSLRIQYHHGAGGAAPVTKGMIDFNRSDVWIEGADIIWKGHKHNKIYYKDQVVKLSRDGKKYIKRPRLHILTGAYGKHYEEQTQTQVAERSGRQPSYVEDSFMAPQGLGGYRVVVKITKEHKMIRLEDTEWINLDAIKEENQEEENR